MAYKYQHKRQNKAVRTICVNCEKQSVITLHGFPNEYRDLMTLQKCGHCGVVGKLATNELAKAKPKKDHSKQLKLRLN